MSICASGSSQAKAGVPASIVVDAAYVQSILPPALAWAYPYLPYMHGLEIGNVGAFCALDPPTWTVPSAADIFEFIVGGNFTQAAAVQQFLQDITRAYLWYQLCECSSGTTPAAPSAPAAPTGLPELNPPGVVTGSPIAPCGSFSASLAGPQVHGNAHQVLPESTAGIGSVRQSLPVGTTQLVITSHNISSGATQQTETWNISFFDQFGGSLGGNSWSVANGATQTVTIPPLADSTTFYIWISDPGAVDNSNGAAAEVSAYCGGAPGQLQSPCCPPDPVLTALINRLMAAVELIQRQGVPFGYVPGAVHSGLSGAGALSVSGLLGAKVAITTDPATLGIEGSSPSVLFDRGFISWGTPDGYLQSERVQHNPQLSLPPRASAFTSLAYDLHPGVIVTITELVREP
jgi:hypothetical protein